MKLNVFGEGTSDCNIAGCGLQVSTNDEIQRGINIIKCYKGSQNACSGAY